MGFMLQLMGLVAVLPAGLGACFFDLVIEVPCLGLWPFLFVEMGLSWADLLKALAAAMSGDSFLSVRFFVLQQLLLCSLMLVKISLLSHTLRLPTRGDRTAYASCTAFYGNLFHLLEGQCYQRSHLSAAAKGSFSRSG